MSLNVAAAGDIEILCPDVNQWVALALVEQPDQDGDIRHKSVDGRVTSLLSTLPVESKLVSQTQRSFARGIGLDYNWAPGVNTRVGTVEDGFALPAGAAYEAGVQGRAVGTGVAFAEYAATPGTTPDLWIATNGTAGAGWVNKNAGGSAHGGANDFATSLTLGASEYVRDLIVADDGSAAGHAVLFASSSDVDGLNGRLHKFDNATGAWASTAAGTFDSVIGATTVRNGRNRLAKVHWRTRDGLAAWRLVSITGDRWIAYTIPHGNPMLAASWVENAVNVDTSYPLQELVAFRSHVFATSRENLYDIAESGDAPGLTSYLPRMIQVGTGAAAEAHDGYVYMSVGRGLERIFVDQSAPTLQSNPGHCAPGWNTRHTGELRGYVTAMCVDQGWLVAAVYNPTTRRPYVCWGKDRTILGIDSPNPLIWHGPELTMLQNFQVTRMWTSGLAGDLRLWCAATAQDAGTNLRVFYLSLPLAGNPLDDMASQGAHRFTTGSAVGTFIQSDCYIELLPSDWTGATSIVDRHTFVTRSLGGTTKLTLSTVADPPPGPVAYGAGTDITASPGQTVEPPAVTGSRIWRKIAFTSPLGMNTPPVIGVLDICRMDAWVVSPSAREVPLTVQYGHAIGNLRQATNSRDPDWITDRLTALTTAGRVQIKFRNNRRYYAKFSQVLGTHEEYGNTRAEAKTVTTTLSCLLLAVVSP